MIGTTVSHYKILGHIGQGGMGVVYKAEDTTLKRTVALKFLPRGLETHDVERARFLQEAQAASALNHPNVCTIHEIGEHEGQQFIVMEFVDGKTLRSRIAEGGLRIRDSIDFAVQIAEALEEAHSKGIVHRDVKAENIMVNSKNQIKVMDFGLAKLKGSLKLTRTSSTVGTLSYMAPEHIEGGATDARSDIFSFGVVLYEMLTGHLPFRGEHETAMMYSILNEEPEPVTRYRQDLPSELLHVLNRALEKDPEERYQTVHEMLIDLRRVRKETSRVVRPQRSDLQPEVSLPQTIERQPEPKKRKLLWLGLAVITAAIVVALALVIIPSRVPKLNPNLTARTLEIPFTEIEIPDLSPDGKWIAFPARDAPNVWSVYFMNVAKGEAHRLTTDSVIAMNYAEISPDGSEVLYGTESANGYRLHVVSSVGGKSRSLASMGMCPHWRPDGQLVGYIVHGGSESGKREFWTVRPDGSERRREFIDSAASGNLSFDWSPDGHSIAWVRPIVAQVNEEIFIRDLRTGKERQLTSFGKRVDEVSWASNNQLFFCSNHLGNMNIWMMPAAGGEAVQVTKGNGPDLAGRASTDGSRFLYLEQRRIGNVWVAGIDGTNARQVTFDNQVINTPIFSPDKTRICVSMSSSDPFKSGSQLFVFNRDGGNRTQLTSGAGYRYNGIWSPDGKWIAHSRRNLGESYDSASIFLIDPSNPETLTRVGGGLFAWWIDREHLWVYQRHSPGIARSVVFTVPTLTGTTISLDSTLRIPLAHSPDTLISDWRSASSGWWLAAAEGRGGRTRKLLLSGADLATSWVSLDLRSLYYVASDGGLWQIAVHNGRRTRLPKLFDGLDYSSGQCTPSYDDKEAVFVRSRLDSRLGLLENVFE